MRAWGLSTLAAMLLIAVLGVAAGLVLGPQVLNPQQIVQLVTEPDSPLSGLVWGWRLPRTLAAFLVGACLSIAGVLFQGAFRNPLAEPYLLGSAAGASLGAAVALLVPLPISQIVALPLFAFVGAWGTIWAVLVICRAARVADAAGMLLVGVAASAIIGAARSLITLVYTSESVSLRAVVSWGMGGVQSPTNPELLLFAALTLLCLVLALGLSRGLDILGFGEATARSMGLNVERFLGMVVLVGALATGVAVTWGGVVGFVGLVAPHILRWWIGESHRPLVLHGALFGGGLVALLDGLARSLAAPSEIPLGLITSLIGGPFFLLLLARRRA